jgi:hypothetical protein
LWCGSTFYLGQVYTTATSIAVDSAGNAYIAGHAGGGGLPATPGALWEKGIGAFVAKVTAAGTALDYLTYLGTANYLPGGAAPSCNPANLVSAIAVDAEGNAYLSGSTSDPAFPATPGAFQTTLANPVPNPFTGPPSKRLRRQAEPHGGRHGVSWAGPDRTQLPPSLQMPRVMSGSREPPGRPVSRRRPDFRTAPNSSSNSTPQAWPSTIPPSSAPIPSRQPWLSTRREQST